MARARDVRLARLAASAARADSAEARDRCARKTWGRVSAVVKDRLTQAGVDPARARALRLAPHPDPLPASGAREQFGDDDLAGVFAGKIGDMARRYRDGLEPDFANASLVELLAWCLAQSAQGSGASQIGSA